MRRRRGPGSPRISLCLLLGALLLASFPPSAAAEPYDLVFSTYLGAGQGEQARDAATDDQGNVYITGGTGSALFPTTPGAYDESANGNFDVFVMKFDRGGGLLWSTLLGGGNYDRAYAIEVDAAGNVYVAGRAGDGFPTTAGALQIAFGGDVNPNAAYGPQDGFVAKLSADGASLLWATYFGGPGRDFLRDMDIDAAGVVYVGASSVDQPHPHVTAGAYQTTLRGTYDAVLAKVAADGGSVLWGTYFGGSTSDGWDPSVRDAAGGELAFLLNTGAADVNVTAGAFQPFLAGGGDLYTGRISADGSTLVAGTYFGGTLGDFTETHGLALDEDGFVYIGATTISTNLAVTPGAFQATYGGSGGAGTGQGTNYPGDGFVAKLTPDLSTRIAVTYLGGSVGEGLEGISVDASGAVYVTGATYSSDFPVTPNAYQPNLGGSADLFAVKLAANLSVLEYSTYLGGSGIDYGRSSAIDRFGALIPVGETGSTDWVLRNEVDGSYGGMGDAIVAKLEIPNAPPVADAGPDLSLPKTSFVLLNGTGSYDPDGGNLTYAWSQTSGPAVVLAGATTAEAGFPGLLSGSYAFSLTVTDVRGEAASDTVNVTVYNRAPVADAGPDQGVPKGTPVMLFGANSSDPDGDALSYSWTQASGPAVTLSGPATAMPSFTPPRSGTYVFTLSVDDGDGGQGSDTVSVAVENAPPRADAGSDRTVNRGTLVVLNGTASSDLDGDPLVFDWRQDSGPAVVLADAETATPAFTPALPGAHVFTLSVDDGDGRSDEDAVVVTALNRGPTVTAGPDANASKGELVFLSAAASDPDGDVLAYEWTQLFGPLTSLTGATAATASFTPSDSGTYAFEVSADDGYGGVDRDTVVVTVANRAPEVSGGSPAPANVTVPLGASSSFSVTATDPDGEVLRYSWTVDGIPEAANGSTLDFTAAGPGTHAVEVTVSDGKDTATRSWRVTVPPAGGTGPGPVDSWVWLLLVLAVVAVLLALLAILRRRKKREPTPPPLSAPPEFPPPP